MKPAVNVLDRKALTVALRRLSKSARAAFAGACAERLMATASGPRARAIQKLLAQLWTGLLLGNSGKSGEKAALEARALVPPEDSPDWDAHLEDGAAAVTYALRCFSTGAVDDARMASSRVFDFIEFELSKRSEDEGEDWMVHPVVLAEVQRQSRDLNELAEGSVSVEAIRTRAADEGRQLDVRARRRKV